MRVFLHGIALLLAVTVSGCSSVAEDHTRNELCVADHPYEYDVGNPATLSPLARSIYEVSRRADNEFRGLAGGPLAPAVKEAFLDDMRRWAEASSGNTETAMSQMNKYHRGRFRGISDRSFASGLDHDVKQLVWVQMTAGLAGTTTTGLSFTVEVNDGRKAENMVRQAISDLENVMPPADCWKYKEKQDLIKRRRNWIEQQRNIGNDRMADKQARDLQRLISAGYLDRVEIRYQWVPAGYLEDPATAGKKQRFQTINILYHDDDISVHVSYTQPDTQD